MANLFAIHKTSVHGPFSRSFYITKKKNVKLRDNVYIISSSGDSPPEYHLEGLYSVFEISPWKEGSLKLHLKPLSERAPAPSINNQPWFNREEFRNRFAAGASLVTVREDYDHRFYNLLSVEVSGREQFNDAIDDLGTDFPDKTAGITTRFKRDAHVRAAVLVRAKGHCEFCGRPGFKTANDVPYLEAHHVIALANDGADRLSNVIALCPEHHRIAHFGKDSEEVERKMIAILTKMA